MLFRRTALVRNWREYVCSFQCTHSRGHKNWQRQFSQLGFQFFFQNFTDVFQSFLQCYPQVFLILSWNLITVKAISAILWSQSRGVLIREFWKNCSIILREVWKNFKQYYEKFQGNFMRILEHSKPILGKIW